MRRTVPLERGSTRCQLQKSTAGKFHGQSLHNNWVRTAMRVAYPHFR